MRILYDYQTFDEQKTGGISRYHANLYKGCLRTNVDAKIALLYTDNIYIKNIITGLKPAFTAEDRFLYGLNIPKKHYIYKMYRSLFKPCLNSTSMNKNYCDEIIKQHHFDIFHPTYYHRVYTNEEVASPIVITVHDMIYESHPEFFKQIDIISKKKEMIKNATSIIAISNFTKEEILRFYPEINESKIKVIYHGCTPKMDIINNRGKKNFILYVGDRGGYKNFYRLLRAFAKIKTYDIKLVCVGKEFSKDEELYIEFLNLQNKVLNKGRVSDIELNDLYMDAKAYISASLVEGFGLPLLEAMQYNTPMIISDIPVYREIVGDNAIYFNPLDENHMTEMIEYMLQHDFETNSIVEGANKRLRFFTEEKTINETIDLYKSLI